MAHSGKHVQEAIVVHFGALPFLTPDRHDHFEAAQLRKRSRRRGAQVGTIDAILAQLCMRYELRLRTTDAEFARIAEHEPLERWTPQLIGTPDRGRAALGHHITTRRGREGVRPANGIERS
jgi:hypothetical protein